MRKIGLWVLLLCAMLLSAAPGALADVDPEAEKTPPIQGEAEAGAPILEKLEDGTPEGGETEITKVPIIGEAEGGTPILKEAEAQTQKDAAEAGEGAPLSDEFLNWPGLPRDRGTETDGDGDDAFYGLVPSPVDRSHLEDNPPSPDLEDGPPRDRASLPQTYDLRNYGRVTAIRNQNPWGTCWAHAALGGVESNYLTTSGTALNLAEFHMAWFVYKDTRSGKSFGLPHPSDDILDQGGNADQSVAFMARMAGPANETGSLAYPNTSRYTAPTGIPENYAGSVRLAETYQLGRVTSSNRDVIKQLIMEHGAVQINYYAGAGATSPYGTSTTYYYNGNYGSSTNHAVLLVGWDDTVSPSKFTESSPKPTSTGAWLVRNSWGTGWGDNGYFWMSYDQYLAGATVYVAKATGSSLKHYGYDDLGWISNYSYKWAANVFKTEGSETLKEVGFYTTDNNAGYTVYVYKNGTSKPSSPTSGTLLTSKSGTLAYSGYHTVAVDPCALSAGEYFSVVVNFRNPSYGYPCAVESTTRWSTGTYYSNPVVNDGESYFSSSGTSWSSSSSINACIKAFTSSSGGSSDTAPTITTVSLSSGTVGTAYSDTLTATGTAPITWSITTGSLPAGLSLDTSTGLISGTPSASGTYSFTVKASNSAGSDTHDFAIFISEADETAPTIYFTFADGKVGEEYEDYVWASGTTPITWYITSGSFPPGLSGTYNASTGRAYLSGTPTAAGTYTFTLKAVNSAGSDTKQFTVTISNSGTTPTIYFTFRDGKVGQAYEDYVWASGTTPITWYITSGSFPDGLSGTYNASTGRAYLSGTPTRAGTYPFTLKAENSAGSATKNFTVTIADGAAAKPAITTASLPNASVGDSYSATLGATGGAITWTVSGLPSGLYYSSSTGAISGTPSSAAAVKTYSVKATATNTKGSASKTLKLNLMSKPIITTASIPATATVGKSYSVAFKANGSKTITWEKGSGTLPNGLTLTTAGKLSGKATREGRYSFTIVAKNGVGRDTKALTLTVLPVTPVIKTSSLTKAMVDKPYTFQLALKEGSATWSASSSSSALSSLKCSESGLLTVTPTEAGTFYVTVTARNGAGNVSKALKLTVTGEKPKITAAAFADATVGGSYTATLMATGTRTLNWTITGLPGGLSPSVATGESVTIRGTPTGTAKTYTVKVTVQNGVGKATKSVKLNVKSAPKITTSSLTEATAGKSYSAALKADGSKTITWRASGLPEGLSINAKTGKISGKVGDAARSSFVLIIAENSVGRDTRMFMLRVRDKFGNERAANTDKEKEESDKAEPEQSEQLEEVKEDAAGEEEAKADEEPEPEESESEETNSEDGTLTVGEERDISSLSAEELAIVSNDEIAIAAILPNITATADGLYNIPVALGTTVPTGAELVWFPFPKDAVDDVEEIATFLTADGEEITTAPEGRSLTVAAWLKAGVTYAPVIAVKLEQPADEEAVEKATEEAGENAVGSGEPVTAAAVKASESGAAASSGSSGGCDAGLVGAVLLLILPAFAGVKRKR